MFATKHMHVEWEVLRWAALMILAAALALALATQLARAEAAAEPAPLPDEVLVEAAPMNVPRWLDLSLSATSEPLPAVVAIDTAEKLWMIVLHHEELRPASALALWRTLELPLETAHWKPLGMAVAWLQLGEYEAAAAALEHAALLAPECPVIPYYRGLLRLELALQAHEYLDALGPQFTQLAAYAPEREPLRAPRLPYTRSMYRLMARQDLTEAVRLERNLLGDETLVPSWQTPAEATAPTATAMLAAWGADNFVAKAHNILAYLALERDQLNTAEEHLDAARDRGLNTLFGYRDVAARFEAEEDWAAAARCYAKAVAEEHGSLTPARKMLQNTFRALGDLW